MIGVGRRSPPAYRYVAYIAAFAAGCWSGASEREIARHDFPHASRFVEVADQRIHYVEAGTGIPILLIHGNPTWSYVWRDVIPPLADRGRVIAVDLVGFGKSQRATPVGLSEQVGYLEGFVDRLELDDMVLVVHDWGSYFGFRYAMKHPDRIRGIAFLEAHLPRVAGTPKVPAEMSQRYTAIMSMFEGLGGAQAEARILDDNAFIEELLPLSTRQRLSDTELAAYREPFRDRAARRHIVNLRNSVAEQEHLHEMQRYSAWLGEGPFPLLMIHAVPGAVATDRQVLWVRENLPTATIVNAGPGFHFLQEDAPEAVGSAISEWLETEILEHEAG